MATATLIAIPVYKINSNYVIPNNPYGKNIYFAGATLNVQGVTGSTIDQLRDGTTAFLYSAVRSSATGDTLFFSSLTPAAIAALANA